jgi:hypothetical protein
VDKSAATSFNFIKWTAIYVGGGYFNIDMYCTLAFTVNMVEVMKKPSMVADGYQAATPS